MTTELEVIGALREVVDPHSNINVYDMGLISDLSVEKDTVRLTFRPTSPFCPMGMHLAMSIRHRLLALKGVKKAHVKVVGHVYESAINNVVAKG